MTRFRRFYYLSLAWGLLHVAGLALAQSSPSYQIRRSSIDSGAGSSTSSSYRLSSSIGQPDAQRASSTNFELSGGFLQPAQTGSQPETIFRNGFE